LTAQIEQVQDKELYTPSVLIHSGHDTAQIEQVQDKELYTPSVLIHSGHDSMIDRSTDAINAYHC
jgi:hypothetical protein